MLASTAVWAHLSNVTTVNRYYALFGRSTVVSHLCLADVCSGFLQNIDRLQVRSRFRYPGHNCFSTHSSPAAIEEIAVSRIVPVDPGGVLSTCNRTVSYNTLSDHRTVARYARSAAQIIAK